MLTGAIAVNHPGAAHWAISGTEERLSQYLSSLNFAIDHYHLITKIVFCENTGYTHDYTSLIMKAHEKGKELEVLTFQGNRQAITQKGKGYGEGETIEYAINHSNLLKDCSLFYKLTGRLVVENMDQLVAATKDENAFIWHPKAIYQTKANHIETYFFKTGKIFYKERLQNVYKEVDENNFQYIEHLFYEKLKLLNIRSFKYPLQISGNSGTSGKPYLESPNAVLLEKLCCFTGAHHLQKNRFEQVSTYLLAQSLWCRKRVKKIFK